MLKLPFKSSKSSNHFLVVDIGSTEITCLTYEITSELNLRVVGVGKEQVRPGWVRNGYIVEFQEIVNALNKAFQMATVDIEDKINEVIFGISGDLAVNIVTTSRLTKPSPQVISEKEYKNLYDKTVAASLEQVQARITEITAREEVEYENVTSSLVYLKCNGEEVSELPSTPVQKIELAIYSCYVPSDHLQTLSDLAKSLKLKIVAVSSTIYSLVEAMKNSNMGPFDGVILDIGGDTTNVGVVFGGGVVASLSLDIGGNNFTSQISNALGISLDDAEGMKREHSFGKLSESESMLLQDALEDVLEIWLSGLEIVFMEFTGVKTFASDIFVVGGASKLPDIYEYVSEEPWAKGVPFKAPPEFSKITLQDLKKISDNTGSLDPTEDVLPASLGHIYLEAKGLNND